MSAELCPIDGCSSARRGEMCRLHWRRVSPATRAAVWATWRAWSADLADVEKMRAYSAARDDARAEAAA